MSNQSGGRRWPLILVTLVLAAAPALLSPAVGPFEPVWGGSVLPTWTAWVATACALVSLVGGVRLVKQGRRGSDRASYYVKVAGGTLALAVPVWVGLFWLVNLLSFILVLPYTLGIVGVAVRIHRSG